MDPRKQRDWRDLTPAEKRQNAEDWRRKNREEAERRRWEREEGPKLLAALTDEQRGLLDALISGAGAGSYSRPMTPEDWDHYDRKRGMRD